MYLLNKKLRNFSIPLMIISVLSFIVVSFYETIVLVADSTYFNFLLIYLLSANIIYPVYVIYPLLKALFKRYGSVIQKVILISFLVSLALAYFSRSVPFLVMIYLAIFLNLSSNIKNNGNESHIVSFPIKKYGFRRNFSEIVNNSSFNILMTVVLLIAIVAERSHYFNPYMILNIILAIALVMSSVIYGKTDKSTNY